MVNGKWQMLVDCWASRQSEEYSEKQSGKIPSQEKGMMSMQKDVDETLPPHQTMISDRQRVETTNAHPSHVLHPVIFCVSWPGFHVTGRIRNGPRLHTLDISGLRRVWKVGKRSITGVAAACAVVVFCIMHTSPRF